MIGQKSMSVNSVLPLDARSARIAAGGGLAASAPGIPCGRGAAGYEPDAQDCIMPRAAESRNAASRSVPVSPVQTSSVPNDNPK